MRNPFRYFNSSRDVIRLAVIIYVRYPLSLRQAEGLLLERGIDVCYGTFRSKHMEGTASDIAMLNHDPAAFETAAREEGFLGFGFYPRSGFIHIDLGPKRQWGDRFAPRPAFAVEAPPARERLAESRTIKGGGVAGVAIVGAAGVELRRKCWTRRRTRCCRSCPTSTASMGVHLGSARRHRGGDLCPDR